MSRLHACLIAVVGIVAVGDLQAEPMQNRTAPSAITSMPHIPSAIHAALQDRRFAEAIKLIDGELKQAGLSQADYLLYLRGRAQTELKLYDQAIATFRKLETDFPKSVWIPRARFGHAEVFMRQRNYHDAGEIYQREAARLLSAGRRDELAAIYLEFADRFFEGVPDDKNPGSKHHDYSQALAFYQQALALHPSLEKQQQIELRVARCQQELAKLPQAIDAYRRYIASYGAEADARRRAPVKLEIEARFQLGRTLLASGQPAEARKTWQDLLDGPAFKLTGSGLLAKAQFQLSRTFGIPDPPNEGDLELGVAALKKFLAVYPNDRRAAQAQLEIALSYGSRGRNVEAIDELKALIDNSAYAASKEMPEARNLLGEILFGQKKFDEAITVWRAFLAAHPNHKGTNEVLTRIIDAEFAKAQEQFHQKHFNAARELWETFLKDHPLDERAPQILYQFGQMKYIEGLDRVQARVAEAAQSGKPLEPLDSTARTLFEQAIAEWKRLVSKYGGTGSAQAERAALMIGVVLEERLGRLADAIEAYKKAGEEGERRITRLTERRMEIVTPRKFRSNEKPFLRLSTRNVDKVTVKIYRVELTDYFRKMHLAGDIEKLDIALIDPDKTFDFAVKDYEKYRPFENEVSVPVTGPGVWAVTVSSEKLEATTMLITSDIDLIVKCSRNEAFIFAEDVRAQKPAPGTRILLSDGERIFAEETTDKEGLLHKPFEELKRVKDLRVFAVRDGHVASTVNVLEGLDFAVGLAPVGQIYTDRPAYRAGELVNLKGIVRWVAGDRFTFKEGERYKLEVTDPRGRPIHAADVKLNRFGTFADSFLIPESVPQGDCSIHLFQPAGNQSYSARFIVHEAKLEQVRLEIDLPRKVYYRGEKIEGKIRLRYYYGTPLANRQVTYRLADDRVQTGTTNAAGELAIEFPTRRYSESQSLALSVEYPERNLRTVENVFLAAREYDIRVSTVRNVYVAGETFDVTVTATDPSGQPVAAALQLDVLEEMSRRAKSSAAHSGERLVETHAIKTDKEKGTARQTVRVDAAGHFVLRASAVDRFGTRISGSRTVLVSGNDDSVRLRILADRHNYDAGDTAHVTLHWREKPAMGLVAFEGASILGYRIIELKTGANTFDFPVEQKLAPNFVLSVAAIDQTRFHQTSSDFSVTRKLHIELKPSQSAPKPGDPLSVEITATDPQNKPVQAELSLALVQRNLLDFFAGKTVSLDQVFGRGERKPSMRTMTSCTFLYRPETRGISEALLAEQERARTEALERLSSSRVEVAGVLPEPTPLAREFTERYRALIDAGRFDEAEAAAQEAKEQYPQNAGLDTLLKQAQLGKQLAAANQSGKGTDRRFIESLYELEALSEIGDDTKQPGDWKSVKDRGTFQGHGIGGGMGGGMAIGGGMPNNGAPNEMVGGRISQSRASRRERWSMRNLQSNSPAAINGTFGQNFLKKAPQAIDEAKAMERKQKNEVGQFGAPIAQQDGVNLQSIGPAVPDLAFNDGRSYDKKAANDANAFYYLQARGGETTAIAGFVGGDNTPTAGERILSAALLGETGYWNPAIVTGADGKATVSFLLPPQSTAWKLRAAGIDGEALAGDADADLVAKKDFFGEMKLPQSFTAGDRADVLIEVQNTSIEKGKPIKARLKLTLGDRTTELKKSLVSAGPGIVETMFPATFAEPGSAEIELTLESGSQRDVTRTKVPVRPYGLPVFSTSSGTAGQSTIVFVDADKRLNPEHPELEIVLGPSVDRALLDAVLGSGLPMHGCEAALPINSLERAASDVIGGVSLLSLVRASRNADTPDATALAVRIRAAIAQLVAAQRNDGGWSWSGGTKAAHSDRFLSSRVVWALAAARSAGFAVPAEGFEKATTYLSTALAAAGPTERDVQTVVFHALAEAGKGDFAIANRLYRERNSLSPPGLLHVALALSKLDRKEMAGELLGLVKINIDPANASRPAEGADLVSAAPAVRSGVELRALYLLALEAVEPASEKSARLADWLLSARRGSRWSPERANGPAVAALADWFARVKQISEKYTLSVYVNDRLLKKIAVDPSVDPTRRLEVPAAMLVTGRPQRINFDLEGRGRFSYSAILSGFVPAERLAATTDDFYVERWYEPAQQMLDGELIPRGFDVVSGSYTFFRNDLSQLPVGTRGEVTLNVARRHLRGTADEALDYLVISEPIPAGAAVLPDSVKGSVERYEIAGGSIVFYVGDVAYPGPMHYTLVGYVPGNFRAAPTVVRSVYQPRRIAVSHPKALDVLKQGETSHDKYRLTPQELYELGKRLIAKGKFRQGADHLAKLLKEYRLADEPYRETVQALFRAALATGQDAAIVEYFEIIKEKLPSIEIEFESILRVAGAYRTLGEYERSFLVYRATLEAAFQRETQIAGFLDDRGQFLRSVQVMERLLRDFPAESYVATATYALTQEVYGKASGAAQNEELRKAGLTRVDLIAASISMLDHFVSTWPNDPAADKAVFSMASGFLELEHYESAVARCRRAVQQYPDSPLIDSFWYVIGYSQFALGRTDAALETCRKVAEMTHKDPHTGENKPAENKWQAIYIEGQIFHSLGKPAQAITEYELVKDKFADAREAIDFFMRRRLTLPEIVTVRPGEPAKVLLKFRNIPRVDLKVYRVDLLKFGLLERNLAKITAINLAGIRPYHELSLELGDGKDYRNRQQDLSLPLKDSGAYLVVCRGDDMYASGLVLVSPLELAVQEEAASGRVRVTVKDAVADRYVRKVEVKVIGSGNPDFITGQTDLRGLFTADAVRGTTTVIARADTSRYAFFRGTTQLGSPSPTPDKSKAADVEEKPQGSAPNAEGRTLLENVIRSNSALQQQQRDSYRDLLRNRKQGVQAKEAF